MSGEPTASPSGTLELRFERDPLTRLAYLAFGCWGFLLYSLGPALPELRRELDVSRSVAGLHPTLAAFGFVLAGLTADRVLARAGRRRVFWTAVGGAGAGAVVLAAGGTLPVTLVGAALMGLSGGFLAIVVPAVLADRHGLLSTAALSEANAAATGLGAAAPFAIALAILAGGDWRVPVLVVALVALPLLAATHRVVAFPRDRATIPPRGERRLPAAYWLRWLALVCFVAAEFCVAFWSTDYLESEVGLGEAAAAGFASLFLAGIAVARAAGGRLGRRAQPERLLPGALLLSAGGFVLFWAAASSAPVSVAGLALTGLGVGLLYPVTIGLALASVAGRSDTASARAALGSGIAIALAPFLLAALADAAGLVAAYGLVPALLAGGWLAGLVARGRAPG